MSPTNTQISVDAFYPHWLTASEKGEECILIDVRSPVEYAEGHVPSAHLMPLNTLPGQAGGIERDRTVYLICRSGMRSAQAMDFLAREHGHTNLVNINGGTMAWIKAGYPVDSGA